MPIEIEKRIRFISMPTPLLEDLLKTNGEKDLKDCIREIIVFSIYKLSIEVSKNRAQNFDSVSRSECLKYIISDCSTKGGAGEKLFNTFPPQIRGAINYSTHNISSSQIDPKEIDCNYHLDEAGYDSSFERFGYSTEQFDDSFNKYFLEYLNFIYKGNETEINTCYSLILNYCSTRLIIKNNQEIFNQFIEPINVYSIFYILKIGREVEGRLKKKLVDSNSAENLPAPHINIDRLIEMYIYDTGKQRKGVKENKGFKELKNLKHSLIIACIFKLILSDKKVVKGKVKYTYKEYLFERLVKSRIAPESLTELKRVCFHDDRNWRKIIETIVNNYGIYYHAIRNVKYMYIGYSLVAKNDSLKDKEDDMKRFLKEAKRLISINQKPKTSDKLKQLAKTL